MMLICEHNEDSRERTYRMCEPAPSDWLAAQDRGVTGAQEVVGIDESDLAWFYIAPGCEDRESCRRLLEMARTLLGPDAWAVMQISDEHTRALCRELGFHVVASYPNEADHPDGVSVHLVQTT